MQLDDERIRHITELIVAEFDWDWLVETALRHGVIPLLHRSLARLAIGQVPRPVLDRLRLMAEAFRFRSLVMVQELNSVLRTLEQAGIAAVPYKGPALALYLFQDVALRQFSDIDLLVPPHDALMAKRIMLTLGYVPRRAGSGFQDAAWVHVHYEFSFMAPQDRFVLDINWRIVERVWFFPEIPASFWSNMQWI
ncbi:MAG: nucleotidyltransferase family protein, partial [Betaproteobacteria bacterium]